MPELRIRPAAPADIPTILDMVRELAVYENEPVSTVEASEADLMRDCFGERANCEVLIGEVDGAIQGFTLFLHNYSTWLGRAGMHVEDLYVREAARRTGLGRKLLAHVARIARQRNCKRLELSVLHWNPARSFYEKLGFRELDEWRPYRLSDEGFARLAAEADLV
jgi:GNAT superfamily N-acetyltransferase